MPKKFRKKRCTKNGVPGTKDREPKTENQKTTDETFNDWTGICYADEFTCWSPEEEERLKEWGSVQAREERREVMRRFMEHFEARFKKTNHPYYDDSSDDEEWRFQVDRLPRQRRDSEDYDTEDEAHWWRKDNRFTKKKKKVETEQVKEPENYR